MIIARLNGGLGNQLFQYAFGRYLAAKHQVPLSLDIRDYRNLPQHGLQINHFNIQANFISDNQAHVPDLSRRTKWQRWLWNMTPGLPHWVREKPFGFHPNFLQTGPSAYIDGYWQSENFFSDIAETLRKELTLKTACSQRTYEVADMMRSHRSVALHIRRGDYVTNPQLSQIYLNLPLQYYQRCVADWAADHNNINVFVFSNDIAWCRKHIRWSYKTHWIDHTTTDTAYEDLYLMQQAECCVTANSTLSWWGGWLGRRTGQVVYTPQKWFQPHTLDDQYIPCDGWVQMPPTPSAPEQTQSTSRAA